MDYAGRRGRLLERARNEGLDGFLVLNVENSDHPNLFYLTGFTGSFGILVLAEDSLFLTDPRYTEQAKGQIGDLPLEEIRGDPFSALARALADRDLRRIGLNARTTSVHLLGELRTKVAGVEFRTVDGWVEGMRRIKDPEEIERIREAVHLTEAGLREALGWLRPGVTEGEIALELEFWYRRHGAQGVAFELIVAFGEHSALPHYRPSPGERRLAVGDVVLFDIGAKVGGYCADMTRTFSFGEPREEFPEVYDLVLRANRAAIQGIKAGISGVEADRLAREVIEAGGRGREFGHGLGHGVGIQVHEPPRLSPISQDTLEAGMVVTIEPGIYLPGRFGVRIEDLAVVREDGLDLLTAFPKDRSEIILSP